MMMNRKKSDEAVRLFRFFASLFHGIATCHREMQIKVVSGHERQRDWAVGLHLVGCEVGSDADVTHRTRVVETVS